MALRTFDDKRLSEFLSTLDSCGEMGAEGNPGLDPVIDMFVGVARDAAKIIRALEADKAGEAERIAEALAAYVRQWKSAEREACAKIAETLFAVGFDPLNVPQAYAKKAGDRIAARIRARSTLP